MKILFFIDGLQSGGKERRLVELIKILASDDTVEMELVVTKKNIHYKEIFSANIKIHFLLRRERKRDPKIFYSFYKVAKKFRPNVIHVWSNLVAIYAIPAKYFLNIPMINNQIGDAPMNPSGGILNSHLTFPFSDLIVANSYAGLKAYNAPTKKSLVIYNGFNMNRIGNLEDSASVRSRFKIKTTNVVGMVASFSHLKDYNSYIQAALITLEQEQDITFLCIGSGEDRDYRSMVPDIYKSNILFLGAQNNIESIMNICNIGVLSTYTEGISNALMEFSALSKPVITSDGGGNKELVVDKETGFVIPQKSPKVMADKILFLLNNNKTSLEMGSNGFKRIRDKFSIEEMKRLFLDIYQPFNH